jgi:hypothetical protein
MKKAPASSKPVPAVSPNKSKPLPWPRRPTPVIGQIAFDLEATEEEGVESCERS